MHGGQTKHRLDVKYEFEFFSLTYIDLQVSFVKEA